MAGKRRLSAACRSCWVEAAARDYRRMVMGTGFEILVLFHILCAIGGFGAVAYNGLYTSLAARRPDGGTSAVLEVNRLISGLAEMLIYAALLFGVGAVAASHSTIKFSSPWVSAAFGVYLVDIAVLHAWIRPSQRNHAGAVQRLETPMDPGLASGICGDCGDCGKCETPGSASELDSREPLSPTGDRADVKASASGVLAPVATSPALARAKDVEDLRRYERRINAGWACFNLLAVGAVYLMVFQPGGR